MEVRQYSRATVGRRAPTRTIGVSSFMNYPDESGRLRRDRLADVQGPALGLFAPRCGRFRVCNKLFKEVDERRGREGTVKADLDEPRRAHAERFDQLGYSLLRFG